MTIRGSIALASSITPYNVATTIRWDGLRLDAVHSIIDTSAIPFLEQLASEVKDLKAHLGRYLVLIAESDLNDPRVIRTPEMGGYGLDAQWSDDIHHSLHTVLTGEQSGYYKDFGSLEDVATSMERPYVYAGHHSPYRRRFAHRKQFLSLTTGRLELTKAVFDSDHNLLEVHRGPISILCNFSTEAALLANNFDGCILTLASKADCRRDENHVLLMPESVAILAPTNSVRQRRRPSRVNPIDLER